MGEKPIGGRVPEEFMIFRLDFGSHKLEPPTLHYHELPYPKKAHEIPIDADTYKYFMDIIK